MLNELVPNLEICQMAKEKGVEIESSFWWVHEFCDEEMDDRWVIRDEKDESIICGIKCDGFDSVPAPLTDEILKVLPAFLIKENPLYSLTITKNGEIYNACFSNDYKPNDQKYFFEDKKLPNALLLLYMKLVEEKII